MSDSKMELLKLIFSLSEEQMERIICNLEKQIQETTAMK